MKYQMDQLEHQISDIKREGQGPTPPAKGLAGVMAGDTAGAPAVDADDGGGMSAGNGGKGRRPTTAGVDGLDRMRTAPERVGAVCVCARARARACMWTDGWCVCAGSCGFVWVCVWASATWRWKL